MAPPGAPPGAPAVHPPPTFAPPSPGTGARDTQSGLRLGLPAGFRPGPPSPPPGPSAFFFFLLTPASRGKGKPRARTSAPPSGPRREPRCTAPALRWASGAAAPGSRLSRCYRRRCNGHRRRLHLLLLPQRPLRRESYITRGQSLLGNVVP